MVKILDLDRLFDKYIEGYVYKNVGKIKPDEIENKIPVLYEEFGNAPQKDLDGKTPNEYYRTFPPEELLAALKEHIEKDVPVNDFLVEGITANCGSAKVVKEMLMNDENEYFTAYLMNILNDMNAEIPVARYLEFACLDYPENIGELATESLSACADKVKAAVLSAYSFAEEEKKCRLTEILSNVKEKSDEVYDRLIKEFLSHKDKIPMYANYLAKYGDERAIAALKETIAGKVNYQEFEELKFAIECLGGEYTEKRDFTEDAIYKKVKGKK